MQETMKHYRIWIRLTDDRQIERNTPAVDSFHAVNLIHGRYQHLQPDRQKYYAKKVTYK